MKKFYLLTCLLLSCVGAFARVTILPDSVTQMLESRTKDSVLVMRLNEIAFGYLKFNPILGRELADRTMDIAREINFTRGYARAVNVKGSSYWSVGDYESALEYYHKAAKASSAINDQVGLSTAYHNIGEVHKKLGDYRKAIRFLETSLEWDRKNKVNYGITLYNIGEAYFERDEPAQAQTYFEMALKQATIEKDTRAIAYSFNGLGKLRKQEGEYEQAFDYFGRAEALWADGGDLRSLIQTYQDFSDTYVAINDLNAAHTSLHKAIVLAEEIQAIDLLASGYERLSSIYYSQGEFKKSVDILSIRNSIRDSLYDINRSQQIAQLQVAFQTDARLIENQQLKAAQALQEAKIRTQSFTIVAISVGLVLVGLLAVVFFRQRRKISIANKLLHEKSGEINKQKEEIESQATELIRLNQQLQNLNRSLESGIQERTHQLWWKNQKLADYAYTNSHKLRAPVASILGLLQLIDRIEVPAEDKILLDKLKVCARDLDKVTRDINQRLEEDPELIASLPKKKAS
jgi:tetratricopeptide (TPR) repeat protein